MFIRVSLAILIAGPIAAAACEQEGYFPCSASEQLYTISVDAVQTTFAKSNIHITIDETAPDGIVHIKNNTPYPLYHLVSRKTLDVPVFSLGGKTWYVDSRFTDTGETQCVPTNYVRNFLKTPEKAEWDCTERDLCGKISNSNEVVVPPEGYSRAWLASGVRKEPVQLLKQTSDRFDEFYLYRGEIKTLTMKSVLSINDDYLNVTCDQNAKVDDCDEECAVYINQPKQADAVTKWASREIPLGNEQFDLELFSPNSKSDVLETQQTGLAKIAADTIAAIDHDGDLAKLPMAYLVYRIAMKAYPTINPALETGAWKLKLRRTRSQPQEQ